MTDQVDGTIAEEISTELVPHEPASHTLFRTDEPSEVITRATAAADALKRVIEQRGMVQRIQGREHVLVSGWQTLGSMLGVVPVVTWTRPIEKGWEARVEARTLDGRVVGAAEAMCTRDEKTWAKRDDFALRSMAQTRATSKALRGPLGFVVALAGYSDTPAEEMPADTPQAPPERRTDVKVVDPPVSDIPSDTPEGTEMITPEQYQAVRAAFRAAGAPEPYLTAWLDERGVLPLDDVGQRISSLPAFMAKELLADLNSSRAPS